MRTTQDIINNARSEIIIRICILMRRIGAYLETGKKGLMIADDGTCVDFNGLEIADKTPVINVEVDNSYLDVEDRCYEPRHIDYIVSGDDGCSFYLSAGGTDINADDISTDELVAIGNFLETTYDDME